MSMNTVGKFNSGDEAQKIASKRQFNHGLVNIVKIDCCQGKKRARVMHNDNKIYKTSYIKI